MTATNRAASPHQPESLMEIDISRSDLASALSLAARIAPRKPTLPILSHVLLRADKRRLTVAATDLDVSLTAELSCSVAKPGGIAVNAADLQRFVAGATGAEVRIKVDGSAWADVRCGKAKYRLPGLADRDFPKVHGVAGDPVEVDASVLLEVLGAADYAVSRDESRESLCGVWIESTDGKCTVASADGHRIVLASRALQLPPGDRTVSARGVTEFAALLANHQTCSVAVSASRMSVSAGGVTMSAALLDFKSTIPILRTKVSELRCKVTAVIDRDVLLAALKRVAPLTSETRPVLIVSTDSGLRLSSSHDGAELSDEVECEVSGPIRIGINLKYITDAVSRMTSDAVTIKYLGELDPIVITNKDDVAVVMPMRM